MAEPPLSTIFKAYDVRGVVPDELDARAAYAIGVGFGQFAIAEGPVEQVLVARDMRTSGEELARAVIAGLAAAGVAAVDLGLASTDLLYFASGDLSAPGVMLTASHNPSQYNGMKFCLAGARPVGQESGLADVRRLADAALASVPEGDALAAALAGVDPERKDLLGAFATHVRSFVDVDALAPLRVVADTANGMGGLIAPVIWSDDWVELTPGESRTFTTATLPEDTPPDAVVKLSGWNIPPATITPAPSARAAAAQQKSHP